MKALISKTGKIIALNLPDGYKTSNGDILLDMEDLKPCVCCKGLGIIVPYISRISQQDKVTS